MYEKYNSRARNYNLHYELITQDSHTFLVKVIDTAGQDWLSKAAYPVMIDATIVLTLFGYESYPVIDSVWQIRLDTVGIGDLTISDEADLKDITLTCGTNNIPLQK